MPKSQVHEVGLPEDKSVNVTNKGAQPEVEVTVKFATGACAWENIETARNRMAKDSFRSVFTDFRLKAALLGD